MSRALTNQELTDQVARLSAQSVHQSELLRELGQKVAQLSAIVAALVPPS